MRTILNFKFEFLNLLSHPLLTGSIVMIAGSNLVNFLNYLYHLVMIRFLTPPSYGELAALLSLTGLLGIAPASLSLVIIKFVSSAKNDSEVVNLVSWFNARVFILSLIIFTMITLFSPFISSFLKIDNKLIIILIAVSFLFSLAALLYKSVLQGLLKFPQMIFSLFTESSFKLLLGIFFVYIGFSVAGAVAGLVIASSIGFFLSRLFIQNYLKKSLRVPNVKKMLHYSFPVLIQSISITSLYSTDIILIKHFFAPHDAGIYAVISSLGKIIFFGTAPIGAVMFPLISQKQSKGKEYKKVFFLSLLLTSLISFLVLIIYWLMPEFVIRMLNSDYLEASPLLLWYGFFITIFTICCLYINLHLSIGRINVVYFPAIAAIIQIIIIWFFHPSLFIIILASTGVAALLLMALIIYSTYGDKTYLGNSSGI
ncbi:MAG: oligosaccharide flippase family protein [Patescibacteria group bacterium]